MATPDPTVSKITEIAKRWICIAEDTEGEGMASWYSALGNIGSELHEATREIADARTASGAARQG